MEAISRSAIQSLDAPASPTRMILTRHALQRYRQRIADLSDDEIHTALDTPAMRAAIEIGARAVILPSGHRAILGDNGVVVTIVKNKAK